MNLTQRLDKMGHFEIGSSIQVKICGLTRIDQAMACVKAGADAIGLVFYNKSPRNVSAEAARDIVSSLPPHVVCTGVFVNSTFEKIIRLVEKCKLNAVQLHGQETPDLVLRLTTEGLYVIKALFYGRKPNFNVLPDYPANAFLKECGEGPLPGGNAKIWQWGMATHGPKMGKPLILAGGLSPVNVIEAIQQGQPDAVDVSSGVEVKPGIKDAQKVLRFIEQVKAARPSYTPKRVFKAASAVSD